MRVVSTGEGGPGAGEEPPEHELAGQLDTSAIPGIDFVIELIVLSVLSIVVLKDSPQDENSFLRQQTAVFHLSHVDPLAVVIAVMHGVIFAPTADGSQEALETELGKCTKNRIVARKIDIARETCTYESKKLQL